MTKNLTCIIHKKLQIYFIPMSISEIHQTKNNFLSTYCLLAAKFSCGLRCLENGLLNVLRYVSATISLTPCPQPNFLVNNTG